MKNLSFISAKKEFVLSNNQQQSHSGYSELLGPNALISRSSSLFSDSDSDCCGSGHGIWHKVAHDACDTDSHIDNIESGSDLKLLNSYPNMRHCANLDRFFKARQEVHPGWLRDADLFETRGIAMNKTSRLVTWTLLS